MAKYGRNLRKVPMRASMLIRQLLHECLRAMSPSSMGLDGRSLQHLRSLADRALDWLAQLLQLVDDIGQWPAVLTEGYTPLIPNPGEEGPLGTYPLTVSSLHGLSTVGKAPAAGHPASSMGRVPRPSCWR